MALQPPFDLQQWIAEHRSALRPPVGNRQVYPAGDFIIMAVGGPNARKDYHVDPGAEFFYQLEGTLLLKTIQDGRAVDYQVAPGSIFLLPAGIPHSPQRGPGTVGLVIERRRAPGERDALRWYCDQCQHLLYEETFELHDIDTQLAPLMARFYADRARRTCSRCGAVLAPPVQAG
jgi:3-hydroxyanthranilate 3,4-dioxygenase